MKDFCCCYCCLMILSSWCRRWNELFKNSSKVFHFIPFSTSIICFWAIHFEWYCHILNKLLQSINIQNCVAIQSFLMFLLRISSIYIFFHLFCNSSTRQMRTNRERKKQIGDKQSQNNNNGSQFWIPNWRSKDGKKKRVKRATDTWRNTKEAFIHIFILFMEFMDRSRHEKKDKHTENLLFVPSFIQFGAFFLLSILSFVICSMLLEMRFIS